MPPFPHAVAKSCHVPPLPAPDSSQPANRLPFLNIDGCIVEQGGHCPVTGENRSKSLAGEGAAGADGKGRCCEIHNMVRVKVIFC